MEKEKQDYETNPTENKDENTLDSLLLEFKKIFIKSVKCTTLGSFVNVESTYENFLRENKENIEQLSTENKKVFLDKMVGILENSIGLNLSTNEISSMINNDDNELDENQKSQDTSNINHNNHSQCDVLDQCSAPTNHNETTTSTTNEENANLASNDESSNVSKQKNELINEAKNDAISNTINEQETEQNDDELVNHFKKSDIFNFNNNKMGQQVNVKTLNWFNKCRYFFYKYTSIAANSGRVSASLVISMIYNIIILAMTLSSLTPIIATIAHIQWTDTEIYWRNYYINEYRIYMFIFAWFLILDWFLRFTYADFSNPYVKPRKAFFSYLFTLSNLYQLISVVSVITLLFIYGKNWGDNLNKDTNELSKQIVTILFLLNVAVVIPRFVENFFFGKNLILFKKIVKSKWKVVLGAVIVLFILLIIFAFTIYETESQYYIKQGWLNPTTGIYDDNAFTHGMPFKTIWEALWYCFVTITTIGYGDYVPYSSTGKIIAVTLAIVGISYFTFIMGILVNIFSEYSTACKSEENKLKEIQEKNNQLKQFNYLHNLIVNDFAKLGLIDKEKLEHLREQENQQISRASDVLDNVKINNRGNLVWNKKQLGIRIYNANRLNDFGNVKYKVINEPLPESNNIMYSLCDGSLKRVFRYKHFSVLLTKVFDTVNIDKIFVCKNHLHRDVYAGLFVGISVVMPKQLAFDAYGVFSQFESKLQFDANFKDDDYVQISLITKICLFNRTNHLEQYGLKENDFYKFKYLQETNYSTSISNN